MEILSDAPAIGQPLGCDLDHCIGSAAAAGLSCGLVEILQDQGRKVNPERFDPFRCDQYTEATVDGVGLVTFLHSRYRCHHFQPSGARLPAVDPPSPYRPKDTRTALADNRHPAMGVEEAAATTIQASQISAKILRHPEDVDDNTDYTHKTESQFNDY